MNVSRRELLRRLGGLVAVAGLYGGTRLIRSPGAPQILAGEGAGALESQNRIAGSNGSQPTVEKGAGSVEAASGSSSSSLDSSTTTETSIVRDDSEGGGEGSAEESEHSDHQQSPDPTDGSDSPPAPADGSIELSGDVGPLSIPKGTTATIVGDVALRGDLMIEGILTGVDAFTLEGNGYQIMAHRGGRIKLVGRSKTGWARAGESVSGWVNGDRVAVAPMASGDYNPRTTTWGGSWSSVGAAAGIKLLNGRTLQAEVANLTRSITLRNVARVMFMDGAGPAELRYIAVVDSGQDPLGFYPIHFHRNGGTVSGSIVEGVVVEGGRNRAFVPHGSHGIRFRDCVAFNTRKRPFWWDEDEGNESSDIDYDKCLAMLVKPGPGGDEKFRLAGFQLGRARRSRVRNCAAVAIQGSDDSGGFWWPGGQSLAPWDFRDNVSHNNQGHGYIIWQNTHENHFLVDCVAFRNSKGGVDHGAYRNPYRYENLVLQENQSGIAVRLHANANSQGQLLRNIRTDGRLHVDNHNLPSDAVHRHVKVTYSKVVYGEQNKNPSMQEFVDCGLSSGDFDLGDIHPKSTIKIVEGGKVVANWVDGSWSQ